MCHDFLELKNCRVRNYFSTCFEIKNGRLPSPFLLASLPPPFLLLSLLFFLFPSINKIKKVHKTDDETDNGEFVCLFVFVVVVSKGN